MFVTIEDFALPPFNIPNLADPSDENANDGTFEDFVAEEEEAELRELLGDLLYDQFMTGLAADPIDQWWIDLRDGLTYVYQERSSRWRGMKHLLVPFIWFKWMRNEEVKKTQAGASLAVAENAERVSLAKELCIGYNEYAFRSGFTCGSGINTLYGFLLSDPVNYIDWEDCSQVEYINHYGI